MKYILLLFALFIAPLLHAEQRVITVTAGYVHGGITRGLIWKEHDMAPVTELLSKGWRIVHVSSSAAGNGNQKQFVTFFVLESPST